MNLMFFLFVVIIIIMLPFCHVVASGARNRGRSYSHFFILSLFTSPILASLILLILGPKKTETENNFSQITTDYSDRTFSKASSYTDTKNCPFCAETIKKEAKICRYCKSELPIKVEIERTIEDIERELFQQPKSENKRDVLMEQIKIIAGKHREDLAMIDEMDFINILQNCHDEDIRGLLQSAYIKIGSFYQIKTMIQEKDLIKIITYLVHE